MFLSGNKNIMGDTSQRIAEASKKAKAEALEVEKTVSFRATSPKRQLGERKGRFSSKMTDGGKTHNPFVVAKYTMEQAQQAFRDAKIEDLQVIIVDLQKKLETTTKAFEDYRRKITIINDPPAHHSVNLMDVLDLDVPFSTPEDAIRYATEYHEYQSDIDNLNTKSTTMEDRSNICEMLISYLYTVRKEARTESLQTPPEEFYSHCMDLADSTKMHLVEKAKQSGVDYIAFMNELSFTF